MPTAPRPIGTSPNEAPSQASSHEMDRILAQTLAMDAHVTDFSLMNCDNILDDNLWPDMGPISQTMGSDSHMFEPFPIPLVTPSYINDNLPVLTPPTGPITFTSTIDNEFSIRGRQYFPKIFSSFTN